MKIALNEIRKPIAVSTTKKILYSVAILVVGIVLGIISKALDETPVNLLPIFLQRLDVSNFFSRMGVWLFCGVCISVYSKSPIQAGVNNFLFFAGMVGSYYTYTITVAGFFPKEYMMIWVAMTIVSPFLGVVCWYAKGTHIISICISCVLFMMMTRQAFSFGFWYFDVRYFLELILWIGTIFILYKKPKQIITVALVGIVLFFLTSQMNLLWGMM